MAPVLLLLSIFFSLPFVAAGSDCMFYFYGEGCPLCPEVDDYVQQLKLDFPQLAVEDYEVYYNKGNAVLLNNYFTAYNVPEPSRGLPVIFTAESYFVGLNSIKSLLREQIKSSRDPSCPSLMKVNSIGIAGKSSPKNVLETLTFGVVTRAALDDSLGLGMAVLFLLFLFFVILIKEPEKVLVRGFLLLGTVYLVYLLYGTGWLEWFAGYGYYFPKIVSIAAIIFALGYFKTFFGTWKVLLEKFSEKSQAQAKMGVQIIISPLGVVLATLAVSVWTLITLSPTYGIIRILLKDPLTKWAALPLQLYYLVVLILPLVAFLLLIYFLKKEVTEYLEKKYQYEGRKARLWQKHSVRIFNFIFSLIILVVAVMVLFS